ncbi:hypothetical protein BD414DRAFT_425575 [Trametes punicea]|nr:hypothetical protein BD414DRAFT_425575 [Trametes punicea]
MPFKIIKIRKVTADDAISALVATSAVSKQLADIMQFPPAQAAAGVLLLVFETIQKIQSNREDCNRLAQRCLSMLMDIRDHLSDHRGSAPASLLKAISKFEETLESIYSFMKQEAEQRWGTRLMRKNSIEFAIKQYHTALDDAVRSFQIASLVNIQLSLGDASRRSQPLDASGPSSRGTGMDSRQAERPVEAEVVQDYMTVTDIDEVCLSPAAAVSHPHSTGTINSVDTGCRVIGTTSDLDPSESPSTPSEAEDAFSITEHHGFNRYHQSQFSLKGKSRIKSGWWAGSIEGEIDGRKSLMIRYEGGRRDAMKRWIRDVKILQNLYHPNLPQMIGYSNDDTPTPFILLANVQTRLPQAMLLDAIKNASIAQCAQLLFQFYLDTLDAALYLQRQMSLSTSKLQDYIEHADFRVNAERTVVMGLPPPEIDNISSWRNYGVAHSIRNIYLTVLPNGGHFREPTNPDNATAPLERQRKVAHLAMLALTLLPGSDSLRDVKEGLEKLLLTADQEDEEAEMSPLSLRQIRKAAFVAELHQHVWHRNTVTPHMFSVGDVGYLPKGSDSWNDFVVCCNVLRDGLAKFITTDHVAGRQGAWVNRVYESQDISPFELPGGIRGWSVLVLPETECTLYINHEVATSNINLAWEFLLENGKSIGKQYGVEPEELILVTRVGVEQRFRIRDLRRVQYWPGSVNTAHPQMPGHAFLPRQQPHFSGHLGPTGYGNNFNGVGQRKLVHGQDLSPKLFYLFTSGDKGFQPYFSEKPMFTPVKKGEKPPEMDVNAFKCFAYLDSTYGFLDYAQLHSEDFEE